MFDKCRYVQFLNISARMSWSVSEIFKPFKKLLVVYNTLLLVF